MKRSRNSFKLCDLQRAFHAAKRAGVEVDVVITPNEMRLVTKQPADSQAGSDARGKNPWLDEGKAP
jgi:hypothetical protein